jgi:hypothetical protein
VSIESLIYRAAIPIYYRKVRAFLRETHRSSEVQRERLFEKLRRNADSRFGRNHGFSEIRTIDDFRRRVPITDYEYYRDYIESVKRGDLGAMFGPGTRVLMFAMTSGTTNRPKFVPVTSQFFAEYRRSWHVWGAANYDSHVDQVHKRTLQLSSNWRQFTTESGIPCGNISGLAAEAAPAVTRRLFVLPREVVRIDDPSAKHYTALRLTLAVPNVGMIITANPSTLIEFARRADRQRESLIRDIHDGTLTGAELPAALRASLEPRIRRRNPRRAHQLERVIDQHGMLYPRYAWPDLSLLAVWMGGSVGVYLPRLGEYYGDTALRDHGLSASEGRMTIPLEDGTSSGILDYVHHYYEFIPEDENDRPNPTVLEAHELQEGRNYFILLTTSAGLYRYNIHDLVRCEAFEGQVPVLRFLSKGAHFSSLTGEKLSEFQVVSAVQAGFSELGMRIETFTIAPRVEGDRPGYVLLLESGIEKRRAADLLRFVDSQLRQLNCEYADKVQSRRLEPLSLVEIPEGTWDRFRAGRISQRGNLEEYKHPCLVNDLQFAERISTLASADHTTGSDSP